MCSYYIAFDTALKPRGRIDENYTELRDHLNSNDFVCYNFLELPITQEALKPYDIMVFVCPDFAKISHQEITEIENWVKEDGGGLLLLSHAGGDRGRNSNLSELSEQFGMAFENDQLLDDNNNIGMENLPVVNIFNPPHPITEGITSLCYRAGCSLSVVGNAYSIASSNETSEPFSCPLICVSEQENGRVCAIGSYEMFRDRIGGGFSHDDHAKIASNIFKWLVSDYRIELRSGATAAAPATINNTGMKDITSEQPGKLVPGFVSSPTIDLSASIKISSKSDLMQLLNNVLVQITTLKSTVETLIQTVSASEDEIIEIKAAQVAQPAYDPTAVGMPLDASDFPTQNPGDVRDLFELKAPPLSALPPKPIGLLKKAPPPQGDEFIGIQSFKDDSAVEGQEIVDETDIDGDVQEESEVKPEPEETINKEELLAEVEGLESKLNSFFNLLTFIEKKHASGNMPEKAYKKQTNKLQKDIDKTRKRLEEIKKNFE